MADVIRIIDKTESVAKSIIKDIISLTIIAFCIYLSQDSKWWTFVTGSLFLIILFSRIYTIMYGSSKVFKSKRDLVKWANDLEWPKED